MQYSFCKLIEEPQKQKNTEILVINFLTPILWKHPVPLKDTDRVFVHLKYKHWEGFQVKNFDSMQPRLSRTFG